MLEKLTIKGFKLIQPLDGLDLHVVCERCAVKVLAKWNARAILKEVSYE